jgi:hypothetical protein
LFIGIEEADYQLAAQHTNCSTVVLQFVELGVLSYHSSHFFFSFGAARRRVFGHATWWRSERYSKVMITGVASYVLI